MARASRIYVGRIESCWASKAHVNNEVIIRFTSSAEIARIEHRGRVTSHGLPFGED